MHVDVRMKMHVCACVCICMYACVCICTHECVSLCMRVCVSACIRVCYYLSMCMSISMCIKIYFRRFLLNLNPVMLDFEHMYLHKNQLRLAFPEIKIGYRIWPHTPQLTSPSVGFERD